MELHTFLLRRGTISLMALRSAFTFLNALQAQKRYIEYDDISQGLLLGANLNNMEIVAHNILIYESAVVSFLWPDGLRRMKLQVNSDGEASFLKSILNVLQLTASGGIFPSVDNFIRDYERYYSSIRIAHTPTIKLSTGSQRVQRDIPSKSNTNQSKVLLKNASKELLAAKEAEAAQILAQKDDFEICEQGIQYLAEIRRGGMDILFPPIKHDKVLSIIFTVFTLVRSTAHKELIDLVMAVKECGTISNLECVSKTKIRGVIALLKLATIIETHGGSNEKVPVTLTLSSSIDSIETLRDHHDEFLGNFGATQPILWREQVYFEKLIWGNNFLTRKDRLNEMKIFIPQLLDSSPMCPLISSASKGKVEEVYVTRAEALENDSLYQSYLFDLSEDDRDLANPHSSTSVPIVMNSASASTSLSTACPSSPSNPCYRGDGSKNVRPQSASVSSHLSSLTDSHASTSRDEWSMESAITSTQSYLPVRAEYRTPSLNMLPLGAVETPATAYSYTPSTASLATTTASLTASITSPFHQYRPTSSFSSTESEQDYMFPSSSITASAYESQSYPPSIIPDRDIKENLIKRIGMDMMGARLDPETYGGYLGGEFGHIGRYSSILRRHSLDSENEPMNRFHQASSFLHSRGQEQGLGQGQSQWKLGAQATYEFNWRDQIYQDPSFGGGISARGDMKGDDQRQQDMRYEPKQQLSPRSAIGRDRTFRNPHPIAPYQIQSDLQLYRQSQSQRAFDFPKPSVHGVRPAKENFYRELFPQQQYQEKLEGNLRTQLPQHQQYHIQGDSSQSIPTVPYGHDFGYGGGPYPISSPRYSDNIVFPSLSESLSSSLDQSRSPLPVHSSIIRTPGTGARIWSRSTPVPLVLPDPPVTFSFSSTSPFSFAAPFCHTSELMGPGSILSPVIQSQEKDPTVSPQKNGQ